jgi:hypothetical protein
VLAEVPFCQMALNLFPSIVWEILVGQLTWGVSHVTVNDVYFQFCIYSEIYLSIFPILNHYRVYPYKSTYSTLLTNFPFDKVSVMQCLIT